VAVVIGGSSAGSRDAKMRDLISETITEASTKRTAPMIADAGESPGAKSKGEPRFAVASAASVPARLTPPAPAAAAPRKEAPAKQAAAQPRPEPGSTEPIRPVLVRTFTVRARTQSASLAPLHVPSLAFAETQPIQTAAPVLPPAAAQAIATVPRVPTATPSPPAAAVAAAKSEPASPAPSERRAGPDALPARAAVAQPGPAVPAAKPQVRSGWVIQVGAFPAEEAAKQQLSTVRSKASKILTGADPFTETVEKSGTTYYRARFAGFDKDKAEAACKYLKRNDVDCVTIKN
jgi:D-alanyl-D-alanine carboxypeptidase